MKLIVFDSGTLISLAMNGLLEELKRLKESFDGHFIITKEVKYEIIDRPIKIKRYELEAMKLQSLLDQKYLLMPKDIEMEDKEITKSMLKLMDLANTMFLANGQKINLIQMGEASCLALSRILVKKRIEHVLAIDERTTRVLVEKPENLKKLLEKRTHSRVRLKTSNFKLFNGFNIIRSTELMYVAYKKGLIRWKNKNILDAILFALKSKGCAISYEEIKQMERL